MIILSAMKNINQKTPDMKEIEKELSKFISNKFGDNVKIVSPTILPDKSDVHSKKKNKPNRKKINFDLKPEDLVSFLDQYIVKQDNAKAILATKICTHFNRVTQQDFLLDDIKNMVGSIKNNVLMLGPTGVGKTYMIKLIAQKIGVPFVKGDATKFSETGYVGGDVEDLIRDLVKEANDDIELAQCGIVYLDEIDKIASNNNLMGIDVSRTGVQRALLKPMEETDVELKVPHDPISMLQEVEHFRKTGKRSKNIINTGNILFIMSGAFGNLSEIIQKRVNAQSIGFSARVKNSNDDYNILTHVRAEDLIKFGFESEFIGRLPVKAVFEHLSENDLFEILKNPNNPIIFGKKLDFAAYGIGKKLDFAAYGIDIKFDDDVLKKLSQKAFRENTGARGLVSAFENALLIFEKKLPSTDIKKFPVTLEYIKEPEKSLKNLLSNSHQNIIKETYDRLLEMEQKDIEKYIENKKDILSQKFNIPLLPDRIKIIATYYTNHIIGVENIIQKIKTHYDKIKNIESYFHQKLDLHIKLEDNAIDYILEQIVNSSVSIEDINSQMSDNFEFGLKLIKDKTGKNNFLISKESLLHPETFLNNVIKKELKKTETK